MKKVFSIILILAFFILSLIPLATMPFYKSKGNAENRMLQEEPKILKNGRINEKYFSQMTDYFSDNFAYRIEMVHANTLLHAKILNYSINEKVIYGKEGWLFFHETIDDYVGRTKMTDSDIERLVTVLQLQNEYLNSQGIQFIFTVAPNKNTIYPEFMPDRFHKTTGETVLDRLSKALVKNKLPYSDLKSILIQEKSTHDFLYHKTDSHWTDFGARIAHNKVMTDIKEVIKNFDFDNYHSAKAVKTDAVGDLERMLFPLALAQKSHGHLTTLEFDKKFKAKRPYRSVEDARIITESTVNKYRIMMFRDSFGNALVPLVANNFGYGYFSRAYPANYRDIGQHKPDVVVYEIAERNIPKLIEKAPVMPAPEMEADFSRDSPMKNPAKPVKNVQGKIFQDKKGDLIHLYGYVNIPSQTPYKCYLKNTKGQVFEAFPILETEKVGEELQTKDVAGFSLYMATEKIDTGNLVIYLDFSDKIIKAQFKE